jgi:replication factor A1
LDCETVVSGSEVGIRIGNPVNLSEDKASNYNTKVESPSSTTTEDSSDVGQPARKQMRVDAPNILNQSLSDSRIISQISALSPYHNKWVIKARVANKSEMRTWSNSRGEGKLFSFDLMDESGEIRCTAFRDVADKYFNYLQVDKVYYFSKCQVKPANKQFNTIKNEYEMTLNSDSVIEECLNDDGVVPQVKYNFVPIDSVASMDVGALVDVIGICKEASDIQTFTSRSTNRELKKRDVFLVDQSKTAITLTLWGSQADSFDGTNNPVVLIKGAKVGEFGGGKNLSTVMSSQIKMNPDIQECHRIKGWFEREGRDSEVKNLSERCVLQV